MGDMADAALDEIFTTEELVYDYLHGRIDDIDAYEHGLIDENATLHRRQGITCRYCGCHSLHWERIDNKWRLFDSGNIHTCAAHPSNKP